MKISWDIFWTLHQKYFYLQPFAVLTDGTCPNPIYHLNRNHISNSSPDRKPNPNLKSQVLEDASNGGGRGY